jgi:acyl-CoA thioesterase FadM
MPPSWLPPEPDVPSDQRAQGRVLLRFEDVSQDGRLLLEALPTALGEIWRGLADRRPRALGRTRGVVPILSRVIVEGGEGPVAVGGPAEAKGLYELSHTVGSDGQIDRIVLGMWAEVTSVAGSTMGPKPADAGRPLVAGHVFAEHVFTRPFGPPGERKVRALELDGRTVVPEARYAWREPATLLDLPAGAAPLDAELVADTAPTVIGLDHTDGNQHVNSLIYPRLLLEAALRRFAAHGRSRPPLLSRAAEIAYRKPSFAGEAVRVATRAFTLGADLGVVAVVVADEEAAAPLAGKPRVYARMRFGL